MGRNKNLCLTHQDRYDEHPGLDVVPLYEERVADGQEALYGDGDGGVAGTGQGDLSETRTIRYG